MVHVKPFAVEQWIGEKELIAKYNIAETCAASVSIDDLRAFSTSKNDPSPLSFSNKLLYGSIPGSLELRQNIADLYATDSTPPLSPENVLITSGGINANFLTLYTLAGPGDHVICVYPTYQQLYSVPESFGAEVSLWKLQEEKGFLPDLDELEKLIKPNTKLIIINNPNNPTGATMQTEQLEKINAVASAHHITVMSDEVYRPLFHTPAPHPPSILSFSEHSNSIATGSLSKAFALAGIRVGWIASRDSSLIAKCFQARDYTTISVSQLDDQIATYALSSKVVHNLLARNVKLAQTNVAILENFIKQHANICSWIKPSAGTTAFVRFSKNGEPVDDTEFCTRVLDETGVLFSPGRLCFGEGSDFKGYTRIGYCCETDVLEEGLAKVTEFLNRSF
ncbi:MAG: hypothetical protein M4579_006943 [Chaenotheca gracillima]|nr:MAG: hypothetical protein M4579_006943 [Chaenotheca gracillima]